ncbi:MAG: hypothetical protein AB7V77_04260 [Candidatus Woesearchaeota archaeon]
MDEILDEFIELLKTPIKNYDEYLIKPNGEPDEDKLDEIVAMVDDDLLRQESRGRINKKYFMGTKEKTIKNAVALTKSYYETKVKSKYEIPSQLNPEFFNKSRKFMRGDTRIGEYNSNSLIIITQLPYLCFPNITVLDDDGCQAYINLEKEKENLRLKRDDFKTKKEQLKVKLKSKKINNIEKEIKLCEKEIETCEKEVAFLNTKRLNMDFWYYKRPDVIQKEENMIYHLIYSWKNRRDVWDSLEPLIEKIQDKDIKKILGTIPYNSLNLSIENYREILKEIIPGFYKYTEEKGNLVAKIIPFKSTSEKKRIEEKIYFEESHDRVKFIESYLKAYNANFEKPIKQHRIRELEGIPKVILKYLIENKKLDFL